jgi:hypothetical protein
MIRALLLLLCNNPSDPTSSMCASITDPDGAQATTMTRRRFELRPSNEKSRHQMVTLFKLFCDCSLASLAHSIEMGQLEKTAPPDFPYLCDVPLRESASKTTAPSSLRFPIRPDGKYEVHLVTKPNKPRPHVVGRNATVPILDCIDMEVLDAARRYLYLQEHRIERELESGIRIRMIRTAR